MRSFLRSFIYAFQGLRLSMAERSVRIHIACIVAVIFAGFLLRLSLTEWCLIILCFALVLSAEVMNTAIERFVDLVSPQFNEQAGKVKDLAAGAVLVTAIASAIIGTLIFGKHLLDLMPNLFFQ